MKRKEVQSPEAKALEILENANQDFYTAEYQNAMNTAIDALRNQVKPTAHWIFSGNDEDYDGYYINCSECGTQRKAYDRDYDLDIPVACPHCAVKMNLENWEVQDYIPSKDLYLPIYEVLVVHDAVPVKRPYTIRLRARSEEEAKEKALTEVAVKWLRWDEMHPGLYVESIEVDE
jgi:hypothetical protein